MKTYLIFMFIMFIVALLSKLTCIALSDYPREVKVKRENDVLDYISGIVLLVWTAILLFGN